MIDLVDVQQIAPRVLARLKQLATLPEHGVVAGQSVASLIYEELNLPISGALNDIDVFVSHNLPAHKRGIVYSNDGTIKKVKHRTSSFTQWKSMTSHQKKVQTNTEDGEDYKLLNIIGQRGSISVLRTYRKDLLNYTLVQGEGMGPGGFVNVQVAQGLVNGFDLNCVAVGIDLHTGRLVCTDDFIDFLNTYELKPQSYHTPGYTLIRMAKKVFGDCMTGITCDFEKEKTILLCGSEMQKGGVWKIRQAGEHLYTFGPKYAEILKPFAQHLPAMVESVHDDMKLWSFAAPENAKFQEMLNGFSNTNPAHIDFARSVLYNKHLGAVWDLEPAVRSDLFAQLHNYECDHYQILRMVQPPKPVTKKLLEGHTVQDMQIKMANSSLSVDEQDKIVDLYNDLSAGDKILFNQFNGELHEISLYHNNPKDFYKRKFLEFGPAFFQRFIFSQRELARSLYPDIMQFAKEYGQDAVRKAMQQRNFFSMTFQNLPTSIRDFMTSMIGIALGDELRVEQHDNTKMVSNVLRWLIYNQMPIPQHMPPLHASRALRKICYVDRMQEETYSEYCTQVLTSLLEWSHDADLKNIYLLEIIKSGGRDLLEQRLMNMSDENFEHLKSLNYQKTTEYLGGADLNKALGAMTVFFERITLNKVVNTAYTPVKAGRKM